MYIQIYLFLFKTECIILHVSFTDICGSSLVDSLVSLKFIESVANELTRSVKMPCKWILIRGHLTLAAKFCGVGLLFVCRLVLYFNAL